MDRRDYLICVDIGHNMRGDSGSESIISENVCAKQIGDALKAELEKFGYRVMLSWTEEDKAYVEELKALEDAKPESERNSDVPMFESLRRRCFNANSAGANLFVSIHLNSNGAEMPEDEKGRGTTIFVKTNDEKALANTILNQICNQHLDLGQDEFSDGAVLLGKPYKNNGVKSGENLYVLRNTFMPAILIETLFVDTLMDSELYKDKKPYINHEHATLEEGVPYVNENVLSYNFFAYSIARGIEDYIRKYSLQPFEPRNIDSYETTALNYVCYTDNKVDTKLEAVIHTNNIKENIYGNRMLALLTNERDEYGNDMTIAYLPYKNVNAVQSAYASILKPEGIQESYIKNLANLATEADVKGERGLVFRLKGKCNIYRSDGSPYCTLSEGDYVGIYLNRINAEKSPAYAKPIYESYDYAKGPIVCEPTKPNWIKIQFAVRANGEVEHLYNQYTGDNYAWIETNLKSALELSDFVLELNI